MKTLIKILIWPFRWVFETVKILLFWGIAIFFYAGPVLGAMFLYKILDNSRMDVGLSASLIILAILVSIAYYRFFLPSIIDLVLEPLESFFFNE